MCLYNRGGQAQCRPCGVLVKQNPIKRRHTDPQGEKLRETPRLAHHGSSAAVHKALTRSRVVGGAAGSSQWSCFRGQGPSEQSFLRALAKSPAPRQSPHARNLLVGMVMERVCALPVGAGVWSLFLLSEVRCPHRGPLLAPPGA